MENLVKQTTIILTFKLLRALKGHLVVVMFIVFLFDFVPFLHPAPTLPPSNVKVTLIEEDTALVSWKPPDEPNVAVTHYTILYASRHAWIAGEWQVLQREGKEECGKRGRLYRCAGEGEPQMFHWKSSSNLLYVSVHCDP